MKKETGTYLLLLSIIVIISGILLKVIHNVAADAVLALGVILFFVSLVTIIYFLFKKPSRLK